MNKKRLYGIRGAVHTLNKADALQKAVTDLMTRLFTENSLNEDDIVSVQFTLTQDLDCLNPAQAVRQAGMCTSAPLFCAQEPHIKGARTGIIRVLVSAYLENKPVHVYTGDAESLRPDFAR